MTDLKPGRELDALIAERVMGYKRAHMDDPEINFEGDIWLHPNGAKYLHTAALPPYSTSIEAAWEVVEKLTNQNLMLEVTSQVVDNHKLFTAVFYEKGAMVNFYKDVVMRETAPHAICLAALKAVEGE